MSDVAISMLRDIYDAFVSRIPRRAAAEAGSLKFFQDGMLQYLQEIAAGHATPQTFEQLEAQFLASQSDVNSSIDQLRTIRNKLAGAKISDQIDEILNNSDYGKLPIRENIRCLVAWHHRQDVTEMARQACRDIETLNAEINRLHRLIYGA